METKITKRDYFTSLVNLGQTGELFFENGDGERVDITAEQLVEFATNEIGLIDRKNEKSRERAEKKRMEGDELSEAVRSALTGELQITGDIAVKIEGEDVTVAKVSNRLTRLVNAGEAVKEQVTIPGTDGQKSRKIMAYKLA